MVMMRICFMLPDCYFTKRKLIFDYERALSQVNTVYTIQTIVIAKINPVSVHEFVQTECRYLCNASTNYTIYEKL